MKSKNISNYRVCSLKSSPVSLHWIAAAFSGLVVTGVVCGCVCRHAVSACRGMLVPYLLALFIMSPIGLSDTKIS